jgi:hypothetical protein
MKHTLKILTTFSPEIRDGKASLPASLARRLAELGSAPLKLVSALAARAGEIIEFDGLAGGETAKGGLGSLLADLEHVGIARRIEFHEGGRTDLRLVISDEPITFSAAYSLACADYMKAA